MMLHFGTDGMRGVANRELTPSIAFGIGRYLGHGKEERKKVLVGEDPRLSSPMLEAAIVAGLLSSGAEVRRLGVVPTAMISYLMGKDRSFDYGIMISASHNPFEDNGIKVLTKGGEKIATSLEKDIEAFLEGKDGLPLPEGSGLGRVVQGDQEKALFVSYVSSLLDVRACAPKVLLDCANGSDSLYAKEVFEAWGCRVTSINDAPNGTNINNGCGSTHLECLEKALREGNYDLGFAFDGDADRVMGMTGDGRLIDGDSQLFMKALMLKKCGKLPSNTVVLTPMSNLGLLDALSHEGIKAEEVGVGDRNIQLRLLEKGYVLGAEPSGHVIHLDLLPTGDGMISASQVVKCFADDREAFEKAVSFFRYPHYLYNIRFADRAAAEEVMKNPLFLAKKDACEKELAGRGRLYLRASGTEPLLRIYVEALTQEEAERIALDLASAF